MILAETARLIIRRLQPRDVPALLELWSDVAVTRYMGGPRDRTQVEAILTRELGSGAQGGLGFWSIIEKATDLLVGDAGLIQKDIDGIAEVELVYVLSSAHWGRGYATEAAAALRDYAVTRLRLARLIALIDHANTASARVATKIGMRHEKDVMRPDGTLRGVYATTFAGRSAPSPSSVPGPARA